MMYKNEAAIAVKVDGKVVREFEPGRVKIPFESEYSIYFKNLADRSCTVSISIDGKDVLNGSKLIVRSNKSVDLERYVDSYVKGNKFKFIKMTDNIANNRGVKAEDGIVRIEWQFEVKQQVYVTTYNDWCSTPYRNDWYRSTVVGSSLVDGLTQDAYVKGTFTSESSPATRGASQSFTSLGKLGSTVVAVAASGPVMDGMASMSLGEISYSYPTAGEAGFTTKGSVSTQSFTTGSIGTLETVKHSACIYMTGTEAPVVTTKDKLKCEICGQSNSYNAKFCSECGTYIAK